MFYRELSGIGNYELIKDTVDKLDTILAFLHAEEQDKITASNIANRLSVELNIASYLLENCVTLGILTKKYGILCPECGALLKVCEQNTLIDEIQILNDCYSCESQHITITTDDIIILYKLIKKPSSSELEILEKLGKLENPQRTVESTLRYEFEKKLSNPNNFFFCPMEDDYKKLKDLYNNLNGNFRNTTEKGNALNDLSLFLLSLLKGFSVDKTVRTGINQYDVTCYNRISSADESFIPSIYNDMGTFVIVECKNEEEKPGNTYYHKINDIIGLTGGKFGIVFSKLPITATCLQIAHEACLCFKIIVINIDAEELKKIIYDRMNLIEMIALKILQVRASPTTDLYKTALFS